MAASSASPSVGSQQSSVFDRMRQITKRDIYCKIIPALGGVSYELFSANVMNPRGFTSVFHSRDMVVANSLWFNAHVGMGLYLFHQNHLQMTTLHRRILYTVFGSFMFNFGSVLFWATCKTLLPDAPALRTVFGLGSGFVLLFIGKEYVDYIDAKFAEEKE